MTEETATPPDYSDLIGFISQRGKLIYGPAFEITDVDRPVLIKLLAYFLRDESIAAGEEIDLHKGIMLMGPVGCGKTSIMKLIGILCPESDRPLICSCRDISFEYSKEGCDVIGRYSKNAFYPYSNIPLVHCFDDFGMESRVNYWGNNTNVIGEILLSRYDLYISHRMITHITTSLNAHELEAFYGSQIRSRMRSMFNLITYEIGASDKRR